MRLFSKKKKNDEPKQTDRERKQTEMLAKMLDPNGFSFHFPEGDEPTVECSATVNLSEKAIRIYVPADGIRINNVYIERDDKAIRGIEGGTLIFETNNRSKAYDELEEFANHSASSVFISKKDGERGTYYRASVKFQIVVE